MLSEILDELLDRNIRVDGYYADLKLLNVNKYVIIRGFTDDDDNELLVFYYDDNGILADYWPVNTNIFNADEIVDEIIDTINIIKEKNYVR